MSDPTPAERRLRSRVEDRAFTVAYSAEDGEWVATVAGMPSLSWLAEDPVEALRGLVEVIEAAGL